MGGQKLERRPVSNRKAAAMTYEEVKPLIMKLVHRFSKARGLAFDDVMAEANFEFMTAYCLYKPDRGAFLSWVRHVVSTGLLSNARRVAIKEDRLPVERGNELGLNEAECRPRSRMELLLEDLSDDAKTVVELMFDNNPKVKANGWKDRIKQTVSSTLEGLGWGLDRITESFQEVKETLS